jgi:shikimate kinase
MDKPIKKVPQLKKTKPAKKDPSVEMLRKLYKKRYVVYSKHARLFQLRQK